MANINAPYGLRPARHMTGGEMLTNEYPIADAYVTPIFLGDPVSLTAGNVVLGTDAGTTHIGVFAGVQYVNSKGEIVFSKFWPNEANATEKKALVWDDPDQVFSIEASTATSANVGVAYDLDVTAGEPTIGLSKTILNVAGTTGAAYKVVGLVDREDNAPGAYAEVLVVAVRHAFASS